MQQKLFSEARTQFKESFELLLEASKTSGVNDEHAIAHLWNHVVAHSPAKTTTKLLSDPQNMHEEINKAKADKSHFLNIKNAPDEAFKKGTKKTDQAAGWYKELHDAVGTVHALGNHKELAKAVEKKHPAEVMGAATGEVSDKWKKHGARNATSKADLHIGTATEAHRISLKKGDSQLMSAQKEETLATYEHATDEHIKEGKGFTEANKKKVMSDIAKVGDHMAAMKGADRPTQEKHRDAAQKLINGIHERHPGLLKHVAHEAATGEGKFGKGSNGSARFLVTSDPKTGEAHVHDALKEKKGLVTGVPRVALPKDRDKETGLGTRGGNLKLDFRLSNTR